MVRNAIDSSANRYVQLACAQVLTRTLTSHVNKTLHSFCFHLLCIFPLPRAATTATQLRKREPKWKNGKTGKTHLQLSHCRHQRYSFKTQFKSSDGDHKDINHLTSLLPPIVTISNLFVTISSTIGLSC